MLFVVILVLLLIGNWFFSETLVLVPVDLAIRLSSLGWLVLGLIGVAFIAWCISDD
jgi:hypothetical protein